MNAVEALMSAGTWMQQHPYGFPALVAGGLVLVGGLSVLSRRRAPRGDVHGSARWATYPEVRHSGLSRKHGVVVGTMQGHTWYDDGPTHVLLCGPTRSHKGICHIQPTLRIGWKGSALILDPKHGENYDETHQWRQHYGRVEVFAPYGHPQARINVIDTIRRGTMKEFGDALTIAQSLVAPHKLASESATSLHFRELAAMLLTAALLHVCYTKPRPSLPVLWAFLTQEHRDLHQCLKALRETHHTSFGAHQAIAQLATALRNITGDRELSSVWTTAIRPLVLYADPLIAASTDSSTLRLTDLQQGGAPLSLYLMAPSPRELERLYPVYRVIVEAALARLMERSVTTVAHRLLIVGEELPAYGYMHALNKGAGDMAGYGIKAFFVVQDLDQFEEVYGAKNTIWGNTETKILHAPNNERTAERISKYLLGAATVDHPVGSRHDGLIGAGSVSYQHVERPLLTTDEIMSLDPAFSIVRRTGSKPMLLRKAGYDPKYKEAA